MSSNANQSYSPANLRHLSDKEHVRERPSMYLGDTSTGGLHCLVTEVIDNSIDEALAGFASQLDVALNADLSITVEDNGRGISVDRHDRLSEDINKELSTLEGTMTVLNFNRRMSVANFLSEWCRVEVCRDGQSYRQEYERGEPTTGVVCTGATDKQGTKVTFKPDAEIFQEAAFNSVALLKHLQLLTKATAGLQIYFRGQDINALVEQETTADTQID